MDETSIVTSYILANMIPDNAALLDNESDNLYRALKTEVERVLIGANFLRYSESEDTTKKYTDALIDLYPENMAKLVLAFLVDKLKRGRLFWKSVYTPGKTSNNVTFAMNLFEISGSVGKENNPHWQVVFIDGIKSQTKLLQVLKNDDEFLKWCMKKLHTIERFSSNYVNREKIWERGDNLDEANKYFFGTEDTNEVKKLFEARDFDEDVIAGEPFYKYFGIWAKEVNKMMLKFNVVSLYRWMKSRRITTGMDLILRMYAETVVEQNPWPAKYADVILSDFLDNIEDSIREFCGKGLKHLCELCGLEPGKDSEESLRTMYFFEKQ